MSDFQSDAETEKERILIFKLGRLWYFRHFFDDQEIFRDLSRYYNRDRFRFELKSVEERDNVIRYLKVKGFEPVTIIDVCEYGRR